MTTNKAYDEAGFQPEWLESRGESALGAVVSAGERAPELVLAWVKTGNLSAVSAVAARGSGAARKAARRGIHVLRSRGITADPIPHVASLVRSDPGEETTEAWLIAPDRTGTLVIVIASRSVARRTQSAFFTVHPSLGLRNVSVGTLSGSRLRDALKQTSQHGPEPVRIPAAYARFRVAEARKRNRASQIPEPLGMTAAAEFLVPIPEDEPHPLDTEGLTLADADIKDFAERSGSLHNLPEFRAWLPPREALNELLAEVGKHLPAQGEAEADPEQMRKILAEAVDAATDRYFVPERRAWIVQALKDTALSVLATQGELRALEVVATIHRIESAGLITDPPHEVPFLTLYFEKGLMALAAQDGGKLQIPIPQASA